MHKRAIWTIIILMSVALLGSAIIQIYWFRSSIRIQEQRFDTDVFDALNVIQERLVHEEEYHIEALKMYESMYDPDAPLLVKKELSEFLNESQAIREQTRNKLQQLNDTLFAEEEFTSLVLPQKDNWRRSRMVYEAIDSRSRLGDIENRIDPGILNKMVRQELDNQGITLDFDYGVYSNKSEDFVIINGNYVVDMGDSQSSSTDLHFDEQNLFDSKYKVELFSMDMHDPPGSLRLVFPNKSTWLWSSLLPALIGTILFTGLILFCFGYTIWVIFRQKKVSEMKTDFINNMTHEFKTPIATISLAADSIISPMVIESSDKIKRFAGIIQQENKRMLSQVEKVLQMALIDKKDFSLKLSPVDMHAVIDEAIEHTNLQIQPRGGSITKELQASPAIIEGDQTHLSNVIHNLLDNANKYSPEPPEIFIRTRNVSNGIEVIVEDHGMGMSKEARKQIFEKFYRVHTGNLHDIKGFGLGLSYVKAITDAHQGKIDVQSEPGKGSSFILYFPTKRQKQYAA